MEDVTLNSNSTSCLQTIRSSKITDLVLVTGCVALLIIGILASTGIIHSANAASLSYGMYAGATLFLLTELAKIAISYLEKKIGPTQEKISFLDPIIDSKIKRLTISRGQTDSKHKCVFYWKNRLLTTISLHRDEIAIFITAIDPNKISWDILETTDRIQHFFSLPETSSTPTEELTARAIFIKITGERLPQT